jgi:CheY-like chemotaxis protein
MIAEPSILVIDDNATTAIGLAELLRSAGYIAHVSYDAAEGLRLAKLHRPDAIIVDFRMPLINGAGFLYRLRSLAEHRHTPVMIVTGFEMTDEQRDEFAQLRAIVKLKPIEPQTLLAEIRLVLAQLRDE